MASVFSIIENFDYFLNLAQIYFGGENELFKEITKISTPTKWAGNIAFLSLTIALDMPITIINIPGCTSLPQSLNNQFIGNNMYTKKSLFYKEAIFIVLKNHHFTPLVKCNYNFNFEKCPTPCIFAA
jgi:hypothetical protein